MPYDLISKENTASMVREFYAIILKDERLGSIFTKPLGKSLSSDAWQKHFEILDSFWLTMMSDERSYTGSPFPPHKHIGTLYLEDFERWLELFNAIVYKYYIPALAEKFYDKAEVMAKYFIKKMGVKYRNS